MKFVIALFLGAASAIRQCAPACPEAPVACPPLPACGAYGGACGSDSCLKGVSTSLAPGQAGTLTSRQAGSATYVGATETVIPDIVRITDQAKVSETCSKTQLSESKKTASKISYEVSGGFEFKQSEKRTKKGSSCAQSAGQNQGQALQREQVESNTCGSVPIPCTDLPAPTCSCPCGC